MNTLEIISKYYKPGTKTHDLLVAHGRQVAGKALAIIENMPGHDLDPDFIEQAAMLHDIGIFLTDSPTLGCQGEHPYICHGFLGHELLVESGLPDHARVCERHVGVGISKKDILDHRLPFPKRDMIPITPAEKVICYADKFFSKNGNGTGVEKPIDEVINSIRSYGQAQLDRFLKWHGMFAIGDNKIYSVWQNSVPKSKRP